MKNLIKIVVTFLVCSTSNAGAQSNSSPRNSTSWLKNNMKITAKSVMSGTINCEIESSDDDTVVNWMIDPTGKKSGSIIIVPKGNGVSHENVWESRMRTAGGGSGEMKKISFDDAFCVYTENNEMVNSISNEPMVEHIIISAQKLTKNADGSWIVQVKINTPSEEGVVNWMIDPVGKKSGSIVIGPKSQGVAHENIWESRMRTAGNGNIDIVKTISFDDAFCTSYTETMNAGNNDSESNNTSTNSTSWLKNNIKITAKSVKGGTINCEIESSDDDSVVNWMIDPTGKKSGSIIIVPKVNGVAHENVWESRMRTVGGGRGEMKKISFDDAFCIYTENIEMVNSMRNEPMVEHIIISAQKVIKNDNGNWTVKVKVNTPTEENVVNWMVDPVGKKSGSIVIGPKSEGVSHENIWESRMRTAGNGNIDIVKTVTFDDAFCTSYTETSNRTSGGTGGSTQDRQVVANLLMEIDKLPSANNRNNGRSNDDKCCTDGIVALPDYDVLALGIHTIWYSITGDEPLVQIPNPIAYLQSIQSSWTAYLYRADGTYIEDKAAFIADGELMVHISGLANGSYSIGIEQGTELYRSGFSIGGSPPPTTHSESANARQATNEADQEAARQLAANILVENDKLPSANNRNNGRSNRDRCCDDGIIAPSDYDAIAFGLDESWYIQEEDQHVSVPSPIPYFTSKKSNWQVYVYTNSSKKAGCSYSLHQNLDENLNENGQPTTQKEGYSLHQNLDENGRPTTNVMGGHINLDENGRPSSSEGFYLYDKMVYMASDEMILSISTMEDGCYYLIIEDEGVEYMTGFGKGEITTPNSYNNTNNKSGNSSKESKIDIAVIFAEIEAAAKKDKRISQKKRDKTGMVLFYRKTNDPKTGKRIEEEVIYDMSMKTFIDIPLDKAYSALLELEGKKFKVRHVNLPNGDGIGQSSKF